MTQKTPKPTRTPQKTPDRGSASESRDLTLFWALGGIVLAVVIVMVVILSAGQGGSESEEAEGFGPAFGEVDVTGDTLADLPEAGADTALGEQAPVVAGIATGAASDPITIGEPGTPQLLIFLAHWCPHCQSEVPVLVEHWADGMPEGVDIYGVATRTEEGQPEFPPAEWLADENWEIPTLLDDQLNTAGDAYGLTGTPFYVFLDGDGKVVSRHAGQLPLDELDDRLAALAGEAPPGTA